MELKRMLRNKRKLAFTLAEVVIVMAILGIMMVAFAPVITKRTTSSAAAFKNFRPMGTHNGIYFGSAGDDKTVIIGGNGIEQSYSLNPKLLLINNVKTLNAIPWTAFPGSGSLGGFSYASLPSLYAHPQLAFATQVNNLKIPMGQLLLTQTGGNNDIGSIILGGRTDSPYTYVSLKNNTILGAGACTGSADLLFPNSVCIGANAGMTTQETSSFWAESPAEAESAANADASTYANANWGNFRPGTGCWGIKNISNITIGPYANREAAEAAMQEYSFYPAFSVESQKYWTIKRCWLPAYKDVYNTVLASRLSNISSASSRIILAGDTSSGNYSNAIFIGNKDMRYSADEIYFGANALSDIIKEKLDDPLFLSEILKPYLWATFSLAVNAANEGDGLTVDLDPTQMHFWYDVEYIDAYIDGETRSVPTVRWKFVEHNGGNSHNRETYSDTSLQPNGGFVKSDKRLKNVGELFKGGLEQISKLQIFNYTYKNDENKTPHIGVMAQDLQEVFPDAVSENKDGFLYVRTEDMFYAGLNAIKELYDKVLDHETRIQQLEKRVDELEQMLKKYENLEKRLNNIDKKVSRRADKKQAKLKAEVEELTQSLKAD